MTWYPDIPLHVSEAAGTIWLVRRAWPGPAPGDYILEVLRPSEPGVRAGHLRQGVFVTVPRNDPKLPSLAMEASKGEVVVHAHNRAVVRTGDQYIKVLRKDWAARVAERHNNATAPLADGFFDTPRILGSGPSALAFSSLSGRSYYELGQDHATVTDAYFAAKWREWSQAWVATLEASKSAPHRSVLERLPPHPPEAEAETLRYWTKQWLNHSDDIPEAAGARAALKAHSAAAIGKLLSSRPDPPGWAHGDLHDKQVLGTDGDRAPGLLDFDESCQAEPALDLANLDVHLELRRLQNRLTLRRYVIAHGQIRATAESLGVSPERFAAYAACTRLRLLCVYSFRPLWGARAARDLSQSPRGDHKNAQRDEWAVPEWSLT
jgi:aminoglycoside phosphotransferase (APT) family kinase protein